MSNYIMEIVFNDGSSEEYSVNQSEITYLRRTIANAYQGEVGFHEFGIDDGSILFLNLRRANTITFRSHETTIKQRTELLHE